MRYVIVEVLTVVQLPIPLNSRVSLQIWDAVVLLSAVCLSETGYFD